MYKRQISNTAEYGDYHAGPRVITADTKKAMEQILADIQSGKFADEFLADSKNGQKFLKEHREAAANHPIEPVGAELRNLMKMCIRDRFLRIVSTLVAEQQTPIIYVSHQIEEILPFITHVAILREGKMIHAGPKHKVLTDDILSDVFGLSVQVVWKDDRPWVMVRELSIFFIRGLKLGLLILN